MPIIRLTVEVFSEMSQQPLEFSTDIHSSPEDES